MSDQFISVITDEAMTRICYDGGWNLTPWKFFISETDVLEGWSDSQIFNTDGTVTDEAFTYLKEYTTEQMQNDYTAGNVWYNNKFSSISKATENTLTHHINIPGDVAIDTSSKNIRTIFFLYQDSAGQEFLYALARNNTTLIFETGVTQSFFFNFTVSNSATQDLTEFILNYSCSHEIQDHNTTEGDDIHSFLLARDGSRSVTGILEYSQNFSFTKDTQLVTKSYVDSIANTLSAQVTKMGNTYCPPGSMMWWPTSSCPSGWLIRNGQSLSTTKYPKLFAAIGYTYGGSGTSFKVPNDVSGGLFIRSWAGSGSVGATQSSAAPNITGSFAALDRGDGAFWVSGGSEWIGKRNNSGQKHTISFNASRSSGVYQDNVGEIRPANRCYLPIIKADD